MVCPMRLVLAGLSALVAVCLAYASWNALSSDSSAHKAQDRRQVCLLALWHRVRAQCSGLLSGGCAVVQRQASEQIQWRSGWLLVDFLTGKFLVDVATASS